MVAVDAVDGAVAVLACGVDAVVVDVPGYPDQPQVVTYLAVDKSGNLAQAMYRWVRAGHEMDIVFFLGQ